MQDVVNNRLPIQDQYQVLELACIATIRACVVRDQPYPMTTEDLVDAGYFNYIPPSWCYGVTESYWTNAGLSYLSTYPGNSLFQMSETVLYERYIRICQAQQLFGAALFSVIQKDREGDFVAAVNFLGIHVLTNDGAPICIGTISFREMLKFGASSTFLWFSVKPETVERLDQLFVNSEEAEQGMLYLHTQQSRECYQLLIDYSYWFNHGYVKED
jgi:hypothetical protein